MIEKRATMTVTKWWKEDGNYYAAEECGSGGSVFDFIIADQNKISYVDNENCLESIETKTTLTVSTATTTKSEEELEEELDIYDFDDNDIDSLCYSIDTLTILDDDENTECLAASLPCTSRRDIFRSLAPPTDIFVDGNGVDNIPSKVNDDSVLAEICNTGDSSDDDYEELLPLLVAAAGGTEQARATSDDSNPAAAADTIAVNSSQRHPLRRCPSFDLSLPSCNGNPSDNDNADSDFKRHFRGSLRDNRLLIIP